MTKYREILRLSALGLSLRNIEKSLNVSRKTIIKVQKRADELSLYWPLDSTYTDAKLERIIILTPLNLWDVKDSYAFQLLGYYLWENSSDETMDKTIQNVLPMYKTDLYRNAHLKMYQSLSNMEQLFLTLWALCIWHNPMAAFAAVSGHGAERVAGFN
jgi:hypothetical protein